MNRDTTFRFATLAAALALVAASCGGSSGERADAPESVPADSTQVDSGPTDSQPIGTDTGSASTDSPPTDAPAGKPELEARCAVKQDDGSFDEVDCATPHDAEFAGTVPAPQGTAPEPPEPTDDEAASPFSDFELLAACLEPVERLAQRPAVDGMAIGYVSSALPGEPYAGDIECWAVSTAEEVLVGSMQGVGLLGAIGDTTLLAAVDPGSCFRYADPQADSYDFIEVISCDDAIGDVTAEQLVATVQLEDRPYPGSEVLADEAFDGCGAVHSAGTDFDLLSNDNFVIYPLESTWTVNGQRTAFCVAVVLGDAGIDSTCATLINGIFEERSCDEPHSAQLAASIDSPEGIVPVDEVERGILVTGLCAPAVAEYVGRDLTEFGINISFSIGGAPGDPFDGPIDCYASVTATDGLIASIADVGFDAALDGYVVLASLEPGTCFVFGPDSFDIGTVAACDAPDALMAVGTFLVDDGLYPGADAMRALRAERCATILASAGLPADPSTLSGTFPNEVGWEALGRRTVTCDAVPA